MVDRRISGNQGYSVSSNNFMGGYLATRHLLELGHRKIGAYTGSRDIISSNERLRGYHAALQEWGVAFQEELLFEGNYQLGREAAALEHFLKHRVSAIFSFNDMMAFGLYQEIQKRQLSIPEDLSIVGFDDVFFGKLVHPTLTTVRQPIDQIGSVAVSMLLDLIAGTPSLRIFKTRCLSRLWFRAKAPRPITRHFRTSNRHMGGSIGFPLCWCR